MFDKMSKRSYQITTPTLPVEQYDPITNWMSDLPPLSKKPRAIHPRQRGNNNNKNNNNNNNKKRQHQPPHKQQQRQEPQQHQQQLSKSNASISVTKQLLDDGLPKGSNFPLKSRRLEMQFEREMFPLKENPQFITSLDYSLKLESNQWRIDDTAVIQNLATQERIVVPTEVLPIQTKFCLVQSLNEWTLRARNVSQRTYEVENKMLKVRSSFPFEHLTALPKPENNHTEDKPSCGNDLAVENSEFRKKLWESENALMALQSKMSRMEISAQTTVDEKEQLRKKLLISSQTVKIRDQQQSDLLYKCKTLIEANKLMAEELKKLRYEQKKALSK